MSTKNHSWTRFITQKWVFKVQIVIILDCLLNERSLAYYVIYFWFYQKFLFKSIDSRVVQRDIDCMRKIGQHFHKIKNN